MPIYFSKQSIVNSAQSFPEIQKGCFVIKRSYLEIRLMARKIFRSIYLWRENVLKPIIGMRSEKKIRFQFFISHPNPGVI